MKVVCAVCNLEKSSISSFSFKVEEMKLNLQEVAKTHRMDIKEIAKEILYPSFQCPNCNTKFQCKFDEDITLILNNKQEKECQTSI